MFVALMFHVFFAGRVYSLEGVLVVTGRQGFKPAQVTLKRTLLEFAKKKGFAENFTDFKVHYFLITACVQCDYNLVMYELVIILFWILQGAVFSSAVGRHVGPT